MHSTPMAVVYTFLDSYILMVFTHIQKESMWRICTYSCSHYFEYWTEKYLSIQKKYLQNFFLACTVKTESLCSSVSSLMSDFPAFS